MDQPAPRNPFSRATRPCVGAALVGLALLGLGLGLPDESGALLVLGGYVTVIAGGAAIACVQLARALERALHGFQLGLCLARWRLEPTVWNAYAAARRDRETLRLVLVTGGLWVLPALMGLFYIAEDRVAGLVALGVVTVSAAGTHLVGRSLLAPRWRAADQPVPVSISAQAAVFNDGTVVAWALFGFRLHGVVVDVPSAIIRLEGTERGRTDATRIEAAVTLPFPAAAAEEAARVGERIAGAHAVPCTVEGGARDDARGG